MEYKTMKDFWPYYLAQHSHPNNRILHFMGTFFGLLFLGIAISTLNPWFLFGGLAIGYAFAWFGHFFIEKNRPATFIYPFKSFASDWIMFFFILTGRLNKELKKYSIHNVKDN